MTLASLLLKGSATKHANVKWTIDLVTLTFLPLSSLLCINFEFSTVYCTIYLCSEKRSHSYAGKLPCSGRFSVVVSSLVLSPEVATGVEKPDDESVSDSLSVPCPSGV